MNPLNTLHALCAQYKLRVHILVGRGFETTVEKIQQAICISMDWKRYLKSDLTLIPYKSEIINCLEEVKKPGLCTILLEHYWSSECDENQVMHYKLHFLRQRLPQDYEALGFPASSTRECDSLKTNRYPSQWIVLFPNLYWSGRKIFDVMMVDIAESPTTETDGNYRTACTITHIYDASMKTHCRKSFCVLIPAKRLCSALKSFRS